MSVIESSGISDRISSQKDFDFAKNTTYGLGGKAKIAYFPADEQEACAIYSHLSLLDEKFVILGAGSNVLVSDGYFDGAVISLARLDKISYDGETLYCQSGVKVAKLLKFCLDNELSGLEYLVKIPASVGGLLFMNGGVQQLYIGTNVRSVTVFDGNLRKLSKNECQFGNKHSTMRDIKCLILSCGLSVCHAPREEIRENINKFCRARDGLPKGRSCGCVFKNPQGMSAGRIIDESGLKDLKIGGARVSDKHANFIINDGGTARDVYLLIREIKRLVAERCGISLEEEVIYIGEFNDTYI